MSKRFELCAGRSSALAALLGDGRQELGAPVLLPGSGRIPQTYALARLLEHGAMSRDELRACTRWADDQLNDALYAVQKIGLVRRVCTGFGFVFEAVP